MTADLPAALLALLRRLFCRHRWYWADQTGLSIVPGLIACAKCGKARQITEREKQWQEIVGTDPKYLWRRGNPR